MTTQIRIKPGPERRVLMPDGVALPADGATVELDTYWRRRLDDSDVVEVRTRGPATKE